LKSRQKKIKQSEQEQIFRELVERKTEYAKENYKLGLPGDLGKFINDTLQDTISEKHRLDIEDEKRREEVFKDIEAELPQLPELPPLDQPEAKMEIEDRKPEEYPHLIIEP
jgi:hypothetical protein